MYKETVNNILRSICLNYIYQFDLQINCLIKYFKNKITKQINLFFTESELEQTKPTLQENGNVQPTIIALIVIIVVLIVTIIIILLYWKW